VVKPESARVDLAYVRGWKDIYDRGCDGDPEKVSINQVRCIKHPIFRVETPQKPNRAGNRQERVEYQCYAGDFSAVD